MAIDDNINQLPEVDSESPAPRERKRRPPSPRKLAANRANAQLSTGPRTPEGKAISSQNAFGAKAFIDLSVLPGECINSFIALFDSFVTTYCPRDTVETSIVEQMTRAQWEIERYQAYKLVALRNHIVTSSIGSPTDRAAEVVASTIATPQIAAFDRCIARGQRLRGSLMTDLQRHRRIIADSAYQPSRNPNRPDPLSDIPLPPPNILGKASFKLAFPDQVADQKPVNSFDPSKKFAAANPLNNSLTANFPRGPYIASYTPEPT